MNAKHFADYYIKFKILMKKVAVHFKGTVHFV